MPLTITVELVSATGGTPKQLAHARIANISNLSDPSDYAVYAREGENPVAMTNPWEAKFAVEDHDRYQSVWALVAKVADRAAEEAKTRGR